MDIQTNSKGKPTCIVDENGVEYLCIPKAQFERVRNDFEATNKTAAESAIRTSFTSGYRFALERLGVLYFGDNLPQVNAYPHSFPEREKIKIGHNEFYLDDVINRINGLPTTESIWRK